MQRDFTISKLVPLVSSTTKIINIVPHIEILENNHMQPYNPITSVNIGNIFRIKNDIRLIDATHNVDPIPRICKQRIWSKYACKVL